MYGRLCPVARSHAEEPVLFQIFKKAKISVLKIETIGKGKLHPIALFFWGSKKDASRPPKKMGIKRRYMCLLYKGIAKIRGDSRACAFI